MLCQNCGQRPATTHIKQLVNGQLTEAHLCAHCAQKQGYGGILGDWGGFGSLLGGLLGDAPAPAAGPALGRSPSPGSWAAPSAIRPSGLSCCR